MYEQLVIAGLESKSGDNELIEESLQYLRAVKATDDIGNQRREAQAAFARTKIELAELLSIGAKAEARHSFWNIVKAFEDMDETVWRNWFLAQMRGAFPKLAEARPKTRFAKLVPEDRLKPKTLARLEVDGPDEVAHAEDEDEDDD